MNMTFNINTTGQDYRPVEMNFRNLDELKSIISTLNELSIDFYMESTYKLDKKLSELKIIGTITR